MSSILVRLTAFLIIGSITYVLFSLFMTGAIMAVTPKEELQRLVNMLDMAADSYSFSASSEEVVTKVQTDGEQAVAATASTVAAESAATSTTMTLGMKVLRATAITSIIFTLLAAAAVTVYLLYRNDMTVHAFLTEAYSKVSQALKQFLSEVGNAIQTAYQKVVSFDYQGLFNDIRQFFVNVFEEIKSYFVKKETVAPVETKLDLLNNTAVTSGETTSKIALQSELYQQGQQVV
jgi:hypothetical protein